MEQYGFLIDPGNCVACKACEIACKKRNHLADGPRLRKVTSVESGAFPDMTVINRSLACMHCAQAACVAECPVGAIQKRAEDGIVVVNEAECTACQTCATACPFDVPQYRAEDGAMVKCDLCLERRDMGLEPACVRVCFYDALRAGPLSELEALARDRESKRLSGPTQPSIIVLGK